MINSNATSSQEGGIIEVGGATADPREPKFFEARLIHTELELLTGAILKAENRMLVHVDGHVYLNYLHASKQQIEGMEFKAKIWSITVHPKELTSAHRDLKTNLSYLK
ncbi:hypothetical protein JX265_014082 [Neoarthrinium moseri]|uniref:Uncharacterized protein n=1 Tax=Neoarthrinium moseri TaxID=1658444 RepID=A0A9P9W7F3_9PEZI|nr:hypothetical protein JX266_013733 [Neoarthrinium moseri]KAI1845440.1 hypothetical protein JX265_014082 [Neoarthrinium moseri]